MNDFKRHDEMFAYLYKNTSNGECKAYALGSYRAVRKLDILIHTLNNEEEKIIIITRHTKIRDQIHESVNTARPDLSPSYAMTSRYRIPSTLCPLVTSLVYPLHSNRRDSISLPPPLPAPPFNHCPSPRQVIFYRLICLSV